MTEKRNKNNNSETCPSSEKESIKDSAKFQSEMIEQKREIKE